MRERVTFVVLGVSREAGLGDEYLVVGFFEGLDVVNDGFEEWVVILLVEHELDLLEGLGVVG